jgi:hypothetical protein
MKTEEQKWETLETEERENAKSLHMQKWFYP